MNVDLPTGSFDRNSQVNLGMNSYSFRPLVSAAWSTESGFDFAASLATTSAPRIAIPTINLVSICILNMSAATSFQITSKQVCTAIT
jgi:hypothetical protein